jgi:hypothetical protein
MGQVAPTPSPSDADLTDGRRSSVATSRKAHVTVHDAEDGHRLKYCTVCPLFACCRQIIIHSTYGFVRLSAQKSMAIVVVFILLAVMMARFLASS